MAKKTSHDTTPSGSGYVILNGSERPRRIVKPGEEIVAAPPDETLDVRISIKRHTPLPALTPRGVARILSLEDYEKTYGATSNEIEKITNFAATNGLKVDRSDAGERAVWVSGKVEQFNKAFQIELKHLRSVSGETFRFREGPLLVPAVLAGIIDSVDGLTNEPFADIQLRTRSIHPAATGQGGFTPLEIASYYNIPSNLNGAGQTIGIIELGGGFQQTDLDRYFTGLALHPIPGPVIVPSIPGGGANTPGVDADSDGEVSLDIEVIGAIAPGAQLVVYFAPDASGQSFLDIFSAAVHDEVNRPTIISISWGGPEQKATQQFMEQFDDVLQTAAQLGTTVCVATGDSASADYAAGDPAWDQQAHVDFPASSPFALACGGTEITSDGETVWHSGLNVGTGGGISRFFPLPDYQTNANIPNAANPQGPVARGIPDVAGDAAPRSGYQVSVNGAPSIIGGTSAVAPLWSALTALLNQALNRRLGFMNPLLYGIGSGNFAAFNDITTGDNGDYRAALGWDACTGLGTPNGQNLLAALQAPPAALGGPAAATARASRARVPAAARGDFEQRLDILNRVLRLAESALPPCPCGVGKAASAVATAKDVSASAPSSSCVFSCLRSIAPGANITNNSILSRIPVPDLVALGQCINGCVPLNDPNSWGGGVAIDGSWRVSDLIDETETLRNA